MSEELKPCPFCGHEARLEKQQYAHPPMCWVKCSFCEAGSTAYSTASSAFAAWNTRTPPLSQHREPIEADREGSDKTDNDTVSYSASVASTSQGTDGRHVPKPCPFCGAHLGDEEMVGSEPVRFHPGVVTDSTCLLAGKGFFRVDMETWDKRASHRLAFSTPAASDAEAMREACANAGYIACAETRHVSLGDKVRESIRALPLPKAGEGDHV